MISCNKCKCLSSVSDCKHSHEQSVKTDEKSLYLDYEAAKTICDNALQRLVNAAAKLVEFLADTDPYGHQRRWSNRNFDDNSL